MRGGASLPGSIPIPVCDLAAVFLVSKDLRSSLLNFCQFVQLIMIRCAMEELLNDCARFICECKINNYDPAFGRCWACKVSRIPKRPSSFIQLCSHLHLCGPRHEPVAHGKGHSWVPVFSSSTVPRGQIAGDFRSGVESAGSSPPPVASPAPEVGGIRGLGGRCIYPMLLVGFVG